MRVRGLAMADGIAGDLPAARGFVQQQMQAEAAAEAAAGSRSSRSVAPVPTTHIRMSGASSFCLRRVCAQLSPPGLDLRWSVTGRVRAVGVVGGRSCPHATSLG